MKQLLYFLLLLIPAAGISQQRAASKKTPATNSYGSIKTSLDSFSYSVSFNVAANLKQQGVEQLNAALVTKAINDVYEGRLPAIDSALINAVVQRRFAAIAEERATAEKLKGLSFLNTNKKRAGVVTTTSGLQYEVVKTASGSMVSTDADSVLVHYTAFTIEGKELDHSAAHGGPLRLWMKEAIAGWAEALKLMPVGSTWRLYVPFYLAYGDAGRGAAIPPGTSLIFNLELVDVIKAH